MKDTIKVWDLFVRLFHWILVASFLTAYLSEDDFLSLHTFAGYTILILIALRLVWGVIGSKYARFSNFIFPPSKIKAYLLSVIAFRAKPYLGHNPAGGAMIFALLLSLIMTILSGLLTYGAVEFSGPLASITASSSDWLANVYEEAHEIFANLTVILVLLHLAGVLMASLQHHENLVKSMITGYKHTIKHAHNQKG